MKIIDTNPSLIFDNSAMDITSGLTKELSDDAECSIADISVG